MEAEREKAKAGGAHKQAGSPEPGVSDRWLAVEARHIFH
jgi:hypothetical protein